MIIAKKSKSEPYIKSDQTVAFVLNKNDNFSQIKIYHMI